MLTDAAVKNLKPKDARYMVRDSKGLYLEVTTPGGKYWRFRGWISGKEIKRALGEYPLVSLREAREKRDEIRLDFSRGNNPFEQTDGDAFREVAERWFSKRVKDVISDNYSTRTWSRAERFILPAIGHLQITEITPPQILQFLRKIEDRGYNETAHRVLQICNQVFRFAKASGICQINPAADLSGALQPTKPRHFPTLVDPKQIGELLRGVDFLSGSLLVRNAIKFGILTFVRPGELRHAEWSEFDNDTWRIPAEKMKMKSPHIVPLSRQALEILQEMKPVTGHGRYVFPAITHIKAGDRPMSENTVTVALRRMGYGKDELTGHGFRSMASTLLNEQGWPPDAVERQLAHSERNTVRAAYNHAEHLDVRRQMMQSWADWLDEVRKG